MKKTISIIGANGERALSSSVRVAETSWQRLRGLLFTSPLLSEEALVLAPCNAVHMFFMSYSIDVIFAAKNGRILRCVPWLRPWRISPHVSGAYFAIELPAGKISELKVSEGETIKFNY